MERTFKSRPSESPRTSAPRSDARGLPSAPMSAEAVVRDLQSVLGAAVERLHEAIGGEHVTAWALRENGEPYVAAASFVGSPPAEPDARSLRPALHASRPGRPAGARPPRGAPPARRAARLLRRRAGRRERRRADGGAAHRRGQRGGLSGPAAYPGRARRGAAPTGGAAGRGPRDGSTPRDRRRGLSPRPARGPGQPGERDRPRGAQPPGVDQDLSPAASRAARRSRVLHELLRDRERGAAAHGAPARPRSRSGAARKPSTTGAPRSTWRRSSNP